MAGKSINLKGKSGVSYDLDKIASEGKRSDSSEELVAQTWYWNSNLPANNPHSLPNPQSPKVGQIWVSRKVEEGSAEYKTIAGGS